jgi:hypothetical protein
MKQSLLPGCVILCLVVPAALAPAQPPPPPPPIPKVEPGPERLPPPAETLPPAPVPVPAPETAPLLAPPGPSCGPTISAPVPTLIEDQVETTMPQLRLREQVIGSIAALDVDYRDEKRTVTVLVPKEREVVQDIVATELKPVTVTDPCTGKCHTEYEPCQVINQIKTIVVETVPETREVVVRVPVLKPAAPFLVKRLVVDFGTVEAVEKRLRALNVPNEVVVPPACPLPPCLPK